MTDSQKRFKEALQELCESYRDELEETARKYPQASGYFSGQKALKVQTTILLKKELHLVSYWELVDLDAYEGSDSLEGLQ